MLYYSVVSRAADRTVLCEWSPVSGNFGVIFRAVLPAMNLKETGPVGESSRLVSYVYDQRYFFHSFEDLQRLGGVRFAALCDRAVNVKLVFRYLMTLSREFRDQCAAQRLDPLTCLPNAVDAKCLQHTFAQFKGMFAANDIPTDDVRIIQEKIKVINDLFTESIDDLLTRNNHIEILVEQTNELNNDAAAFNRSSRQLRRREWWKAKRLLLGATLLIIGITSLILITEMRTIPYIGRRF